MRAAVFVVLLVGLLGGGVALGWDLVVQTEEEQVEEMIRQVADARDGNRATTFMRHVALESYPLRVSAPGLQQTFDAGDQAALADLVSHLQEELSGAEVSVVQSNVDLRQEVVHVTVNVRLSRGRDESYAPMDLTLHRLGGGFVVTELRVQH